MTRLRQKAQTCEFGDANTTEEQICNQVISKCLSQTLLKVTSEQALTLQQLREIGCAMEEPETDHKPLECIFLPKCKTCTRIKRWLLRMQPYRFTV